MTNYGLVGSETPIDDLLAQYFPGRPNSVMYDLFESEQTALLAALLMELRGDDVDQTVTGDSEPVYYSTGEDPITVDSAEEDTVEWDFTASTAILYGFDQPIHVAYKAPNKPNRIVALTQRDSPFTLSGVDGINASQLYYRLPEEGATPTSFNLIAVK